MTQQYIALLKIGLMAAGLLLIPLLAMIFTHEVVWSPGDFIIAWLLLTSAGVAYKLVASRLKNPAYKYAVGIAVFTALLLVWMNLAVGLIGSEDNPANLLYAGVLLVGLVGVLVARLEPRRMSRAFFVTSAVQALVPFIALVIWKPPLSTMEQTLGVLGVIALNTVFAALWYASARLFRKVAREQTLPNYAP